MKLSIDNSVFVWIQLFGIVPQHPFLFSGTLLENIAVDAVDYTPDSVAILCRNANLGG